MPLRDDLQSVLGDAYTLDRELGGGGMSRVFLAEERALGRSVVVKVLPPDLLAGVNVERFNREILLAARLQHPHIVPVLTAGEMNGVPFYTMPFVEGESLRIRLADGPLPITETIGILRDVARALSYAHTRGVVHRDIKPDNVLLAEGSATVTDFGIAKALAAAKADERSEAPQGTALTGIGVSIGTPTYMAPEQIAGDPSIDARADIYSFGCMAFELLAGRPPFAGLSPQRLLAAHLGERPPAVTDLRPDTPAFLAKLVARCLEKNPADRPATAAEIVQTIESSSMASGDVPVPGPRAISMPVALGAWLAAFAAAGILAKAAIVGIGLPSWVLPGALVVAGLGLPVILLTFFAQSAARAANRTPTMTPGGSIAPPSTMATMAMRVSPHVTWRRTVRGGIIAFAAFGLAIGAFMTLRAMGIGPAGSLLAAGVIKDRDPVLIADFSSAGDDSTLGRAVTEAIRTDLGQSDVIRLTPASEVIQTLALMEKPATTPIDTGVARIIAARRGIKAVLGGDVSRVAGSYLLTARLITPSTGDVLAAFRESAADQKDVVPAIERLSRSLRAKLGESMRRIQRQRPLDEVTTGSLDALRLYAQGLHVGDDLGRVPDGRALLLEAVKRDSTFAMAWRKLGTWANNAGDPYAFEFARKAAQYSDRLQGAERFSAMGSWHTTAGDGYAPDSAIAVYRGGLNADSTNATLRVNLAIQQSEVGEIDSALVNALRVSNVNAYGRYHAALFALAAGHEAQSESLMTVAHERTPDFPYRSSFDAGWYYARGRLDSVELVPRGTFQIISARIAQGRLAKAEQLARASADSALARGETWTAAERLLMLAWAAAEYRGDRAGANRILAEIDQRTPLEKIPLVRRPYYLAAAVHVAAGNIDRARTLIRAGDASFSSGLKRWTRESHAIAVAMVDAAEGHPAEGPAAFRDATSACVSTAPRASRDIFTCPEPFLAAAFDRAGQPDSAIAHYEHYLGIKSIGRAQTDALILPQTLQRLGELYEAKNDRQKAAHYYGQLLDLWKTADPSLAARREDVRKRVARLADSEKH